MRVKRGIVRHRKHKKLLGKAKGYRSMRHSAYRKAKEAVTHAGKDAYISRRLKKRDFRSLWIVRLNATLRDHGTNYSTFISKLKAKKIELNRKTLSELAVNDMPAFEAVLKAAGL